MLNVHAKLLDWKTALDLTDVAYLGSAVLGLMINLRQQVKRGGGKLVLCGLSARLMQVFQACCMERLFIITRTRPDALRAAQKR